MNFGDQSENFSVEQNPTNKKRKIIIADVGIENQARDMAEEKMTASKGELKGVKGFFNKIWKHNLAHEYYRQKELAKARREIRESGNLYAGENGEKIDHDEAMKAIVDRFAMEYENDGALRKGEEKKILQEENPEEKTVKNIIKNLVERYATGNITEEQFILEKNNFFEKELNNAENKQGKALIQKGSLYADNLLEIAEQVKADISHDKGLEALDLDFEIIIGKAKAGVETQAQHNAVDKIVEKFKKTSGGRFISQFVNETTVASAVAIAYGFGVKGAINATQRTAKWVGPLGLGLSAGIGGAVAGVRENKRIKEERAQHIREMAKGKSIEAGSIRREEMEKFRYETKSANDLTANLVLGLTKLRANPTEEQLAEVIKNISEIDARILFSERESIDLINFSDAKRIEKERTRMINSTIEAKDFLKKNIGKDWATFYGNEDELKKYLAEFIEQKISNEFIKDKKLKDEAFAKMKRNKVAWAFAKGVSIGAGIGLVAQEIQAAGGDSQEGIFNASEIHNSDQIRHFTSSEYLRRYIYGDLPPVDAGHLPQTFTQHIEGSEHVTNIGTKDYIKNHEDLFSKIKRGHWADNDSLKPDKNELKLWWGGEKGTGIDSNGNYVFNVKNMASEGSAHGGVNWNPQELMKDGKMKLLVSLSGDTQNQVAEIPIDASGNAIINPNSEIGKLVFQNVDGHAKFIGKFAEVAVVGENKDGVDYVDILATHKGEGVDNVAEIIKNPAYDIENMIPGKPPSGYDVDLPYAIPIVGRRPLEKLEDQAKTEEAVSFDEQVFPQQQEIAEWEQLDLFEDFLTATELAVLTKKKETTEKEQKEKLGELLVALKHSREQIEKAEEDAKNTGKKDGLARVAALHTIYKLENSPDLKYADLNANSVTEGDSKFLDLTRRLWTELTVHEKPDRDANACLKLVELAGIKIDKVGLVKAGDMAESGITMDTSMKDGVVVEGGGKRLILDHHGKESDRTTSAAKFVYETLLEIGLLKKEEYLDKFVEFVTKCDNMNFTPEEMNQVYKNYSKNLYGLSFKMKTEDILDLFRSGVDPMDNLAGDYLKSHEYFNPQGRGKYEPLIKLSEYMESQMKKGKNSLENVERLGYVVDTGANRFGKILIDTKKKADKDKYYCRVDGDNNSNQLEVFLKGYGGYLIWSPGENSFVLYTQRKVDEVSVPGGFSQGFNMRGNMWMKSQKDLKKMTITLEEILSKLSGRDFKIEGDLQKLLKLDQGGKNMLDLLDDGKLTEDILIKTSREINVPTRKLLTEILKQRNSLNQKFLNKAKKVPKDKNSAAATNKIAIDLLLDYQKNKNVNSGQEKQKNMAEAVRKLSGMFLNFKLYYEAIEKEAKKIDVEPSDLVEQFIQSNSELRSKFEAIVNTAPKKFKEKLAIKIILENEKKRLQEKIKNEGENDNLRLLMREIEVDLFDIKMKTGQ